MNDAQEVCATCGPWACEDCGARSSHAYKRVKTTKELHFEARALMGYGEDITRCKNCWRIKPTGDMGICLECAMQKVEEHKEELVCKDCLSAAKTEWYPDSRGEGSCIRCGMEAVLNEDNLCRICFDSIRKPSRKIRKIRRCWNCQEKFLVLGGDDHFCALCQVRCEGCGGVFSPETKDQAFCESCLNNIINGQCTLCDSATAGKNFKGHCHECARGDLPVKTFCAVCSVKEVESLKAVCPDCVKRTKDCPRCYEHTIPMRDYICQDCKNREE